MSAPRRQRLDPARFELPIEEIRAGRYSDKYFVRTRDVLRADAHRPNVLMQVFCKTAGVLCGMDEAVALLKLASDDWSGLSVRALHDGDAAHVAGATGAATDMQTNYWGGSGFGTLPHAAIAAYGGDTVLAATKFAEHLPESVDLVVLVDFDNDSVGTSLAVARALGERLYGVRLDTSGTLVDRSVVPQMGQFDPRGVNAQLVCNVRDALDDAGFEGVRIVASGGFDAERIRRFEGEAVPVDAYGIGSSLVANDGAFDFTADIVQTDGRPSAKVGRTLRPNPQLEAVT